MKISHQKLFVIPNRSRKPSMRNLRKNTLSCWTTAKHLSSTPLYKRFVFPAVVRIRVSFLTYATFRMTYLSSRTKERIYAICIFGRRFFTPQCSVQNDIAFGMKKRNQFSLALRFYSWKTLCNIFKCVICWSKMNSRR